MPTYDPRKVIVTVGTAQIMGFADGTIIAAERQEDAVMLAVGTQGETAWSINRNRSGIITLTLLHTSLSNDLLDAMALADELSGGGSRIASIEDLNGTTLVNSKDVKVKKRPKVEYGKEVASREWQLLAGDLNIKLGGNLL